MAVHFHDNANEQYVIDYQEDTAESEDANQFELLCDGVINILASVHTALQEHMDFKDELMEHFLPPGVHLKLALTSGKLFRSLSDLQTPLNELVRLVRVYSAPWEQKSEALKKLHDDYESKSAQLNIALRRLGVQEAEANRVAREKRILNWERLFARAQLARGHGRRWKFRMHDFKQKSEKGIEHLRDYFREACESDLDERDRTIAQLTMSMVEKEEKGASPQAKAEAEETDPDTAPLGDVSVEDLDVGEEGEEEEERDSPEPVETAEAGVWTGEPDCEHYLHARVYLPTGLSSHLTDVRCQVVYGPTIQRTGPLDKPAPTETTQAAPVPDPGSKPAGGRRGLIGSKAGAQPHPKTPEQIRRDQLEKRRRELANHEEVTVEIPASVLGGVNRDSLYQAVQFIVTSVGEGAPSVIGRATLDMTDIKGLDLPVHELPSDQGDITSPPDTPTGSGGHFPDLEPIAIPLYPALVTAEARSGGSVRPIGTLPLACFWARRQIHTLFHRLTDTGNVYDLIETMTGIDLRKTSKEELTRERIPVALSPRPQTPLPPSVTKEEFESLAQSYQDQMDALQQQYESRLQSLSEELMLRRSTGDVIERGSSPIARVRSGGSSASQHRQSHSRSATPAAAVLRQEMIDRGVSPWFWPQNQSDQPPHTTQVPGSAAHGPRVQSGSGGAVRPNAHFHWGSQLPRDFLDRVAMFSELSQRHRLELSDRMRAEMAMAIEQRLAETSHLTSTDPDLVELAAFRDLCLPALFMPTRNAAGTVYNPRAHLYFHATGASTGAGTGVGRLTQPPAIFQLPPLTKNQVSVLNLLDAGNQHLRSRPLISSAIVGPQRVRSQGAELGTAADRSSQLKTKQRQGRLSVEDGQEPSAASASLVLPSTNATTVQ